MKLIIAGGRDMEVTLHFIDEVIAFFQIQGIHEIVSGASGLTPEKAKFQQYANGIDGCGEKWAAFRGLGPATRKYADFKKHGKPGGPIRNKEMAEYADALLLIWNGESSGSSSMKVEMLNVRKPVYEIVLRRPGGKSRKL